MRPELSVIVLSSAVALACAGGEGPAAASSDTEMIPADSVRVVGTSDVIGHIADVVEGDDGTIWVLNSAEPYFIAMSADGSIGRTWGANGGGPDEFRNPGVLIRQGGHVWVYDGRRHAILRIDGTENGVETISIPRDSIPPSGIASTENAGSGGRAWIRGVDSGFLMAVGRDRSALLTRLWKANLTLLRDDGRVSVEFAVGDRLGDPTTRYGGAATQFLPYPLWALCSDGSVAVYDPLRDVIDRVAPGDEVRNSIGLPPERDLEVTLDRAFRMTYRYMIDQAPPGLVLDSAMVYGQLEQAWPTLREQVSDVFPEYADLQCSAENTLWLQRFDPDHGMMGRGPEWLRINADGIRAYSFPESFRPLRFEADRVFGVRRDGFDVESVAWMPLPGA